MDGRKHDLGSSVPKPWVSPVLIQIRLHATYTHANLSAQIPNIPTRELMSDLRMHARQICTAAEPCKHGISAPLTENVKAFLFKAAAATGTEIVR